ncbi:MAG TPA: hypothetical protein VIS06_06725, partial [Mycobacteriales bacterium]
AGRRWPTWLNLPPTGWRLVGVGTAVAVYLAAGLPWYRIGVDRCVHDIGQADSASLRAACEHVALSGWQVSRWGVLLALTAGVVMLARLARRGRVLLDLLAPLAASLGTLLTARALFDSADRQQLDLTWPGPLVLLPLLGVLTVAGAQVYRLEHLAGVSTLGQAGARVREQVGERPLRIPGWLRPAGVWRHRRRWLAGAGVLGLVLVAHGCAQHGALGGLGNAPGVTDPQAGGGPGPGQSEPGGPSDGTGDPRPTPSATSPTPDGARLLTATKGALARAHSVDVAVRSLAGTEVSVDLRLTSDRRAEGTVMPSALATYDIRRVGDACWVRGLPGHGVAAWVRTCTVPAADGVPAIDLAALTDWRVMVTPLPDPAGARTADQPERLGIAGEQVWRVTSADGSVVYLPAESDADLGTGVLPVRIHSAQPRPGGVTEVDYSGWNDRVAITPP